MPSDAPLFASPEHVGAALGSLAIRLETCRTTLRTISDLLARPDCRPGDVADASALAASVWTVTATDRQHTEPAPQPHRFGGAT